ncbi:hypothetical protein PIB30_030739 [Stylosanthes scabra]|uniref:H/ACA ribonucleoprotein complex non-core subunit NAF1 n=1 Tax=Stylosanthes scabra TaxID=79078 RepID=A0ABU6WDQ2_9FABA|nr:hypothetical protein [Stylosanthes scabra]
MDSLHTTTTNNDGVPLADSNGSGLNPNSNEPIKEECEKFETLGCAIEEGVEKISLLGASETQVKAEIEAESESESESESEEDSEGATSSSSSESSSSSSEESSSDDSDSDDGDEEEEGEEKGKDADVEEGEIDGSDDDVEKMVSWSMEDDGGDGDDDEADVGGGPIKSKNELEDLPPVPPVNVTLEPSHQMRPVGGVMSKLGAKVIVEGIEKHDPLSEGSILWITESRKPLGLIDEIFGPVKTPYYIVRYNSENEVPSEVQGGTLISFVPEFANYVLNNNKDLYKKGYDASGANDEELSDEVEFSDDEKEAEYRRMQRMAKRGPNDQNSSKSKHNKKKVSPQKHAATSIPKAPTQPAAPPHDRGNCLPFPGQGQAPFGGTSAFPPFQIPNSNAGPNFPPNGVWTTGPTLPQQPLPSVLPNVFPTNGMSWCPQNTQYPHQLPMAMPGVPFQQRLPQGAMLPGVVQQNILAQAAIYAQGLMAQNQMAFGLNSPPFPQMQQPPMPQQGFPHNESSPNPGGPPQFHPGASASNNGGKTFHGAGRGGRKGWRPTK